MAQKHFEKIEVKVATDPLIIARKSDVEDIQKLARSIKNMDERLIRLDEEFDKWDRIDSDTYEIEGLEELPWKTFLKNLTW